MTIYSAKDLYKIISYKKLRWMLDLGYLKRYSLKRYLIDFEGATTIDEINLEKLEALYQEYLTKRKQQIIENYRQITKKLWENPEYRSKVTKAIKEGVSTEEAKMHFSEAAKRHWQDTTKREKTIQSIRATMKTDTYKETRSKVSKDLWKNDDYRNRVISSVTNSLNTEEVRQKRSNSMKKVIETTDMKQKISRTLKVTYQNPEVRKKVSEGVKRAFAKPEVKEKLVQSIRKVFSERNKDIQQKRFATIKKNKSYKESSTECSTYRLLLTKFVKEDIECQYFDKQRYPFKCDFYIKSLDLFIECHYGWRHSNEPFDNSNKEHLEQLKIMQEKAKTSKNYQNAIYQWTDLDVRKRQCAIDNKLNWKAFYSLEEFNEWLKVYN